MEKLPELKEGTLSERFEKLRAKVNEIVGFVNGICDDPDDTMFGEHMGDVDDAPDGAVGALKLTPRKSGADGD